MALFRPYKITSDQLSSLAKTEGQLIVVSDTNEMYIDVSNTSRIRIGESLYTKLANIAEGATKVEASSTNGKIKINGTDTIVYTHPTTTAVTAAAVKVGKDSSGHVVLGNALAASDVGAIATTAKGAANGVAELDSTGKVPSSQLPSFVDDVLEYDKQSSFPTTGEAGKIYIAKDTNKTYRWSGSAYVEISASLALGETSSTAYRGDRGKTAYDHSQLTSGNPHNVTKSDVGLGNVGNFKAVSTVASQGLTDTEKSNARANIGAGISNLTIGTTSTTAAAGNHTHSASLTTDTGTSAITLAHGEKYKLTAGGSSVIFTMPASDGNTTYTFAEGSTNGAFSVTPSGGSAQSVKVHGLAAAAYKAVDSSVTISSTSTNVPTSAAVAGLVSSALT